MFSVFQLLLFGILLSNFHDASGNKNLFKSNTALPITEKVTDKIFWNLAKNDYKSELSKNNSYDTVPVSSEATNIANNSRNKANNITKLSPDELLHGSYESVKPNYNLEKDPVEVNTDFEPKQSEEIKDDTNANSTIPSRTHYTNVSIFDQKEDNNQQELAQLTKLPVAISTTGIPNYSKETLPKCPDGFAYPKDQFGGSICYLITEPTTFPPSCPYPYTTPYIDVDWSFAQTNQTMWKLAKRNITDGFGPFEWTNGRSSLNFYKQVSNDEQESVNLFPDYYEQENVTAKNCLVYNYNISKNVPAYCDEKHPYICSYSYDGSFEKSEISNQFQDYCKRRYNSTCFSNNLRPSLTCFCKNTAQEEKPRSTFCKKLVEIKTPSENDLLIRLLYNDVQCWIGLHKVMESYQWSSTNTTSTYTFWDNNTDFTKNYGAIGTNGWSLEDDGALSCAICEIEPEDHPPVQLHIKRKTNVVEVQIKNAIEVYHQIVTCFAHNSTKYRSINLSGSKETFQVFNIEFPFTTSGYYWCKALQMPNLTPVYSNTLFIDSTDSNNGHEYAVSMTFPEKKDPHLHNSDVLACNSLNNSSGRIHNSRPIKIIQFNEEQGYIQVLCHINTIPEANASITKSFEYLSELLSNSNANITIASTEVCLPSTTISGSRTLHWPETPMGVTTIPEELCVQEDGSPVTRTCSGSFYYGSRWLDVNGSCADLTFSPRTLLLDDLLRSKNTTHLGKDLLNITEDTNNFTNLEIHLLSKALEKLADCADGISVKNVAKMVNNIMHFDRSKLSRAQNILNSTDMILCSLDDMLASTEVNASGLTSAVTEKVLVQINDLRKTNIVGIKLGISQNGFDSNKINPVISQEDLTKDNFDLAMIIPQQLHDDIIKCMGPERSANLITTVFYDDVLFCEQQNTSHHPDGRIISATIPGFDCTFTTPLRVVFNPSPNNNTQLKCASWVYGSNDLMESIHGQWFVEGDPKSFGNSYQVCEFTHITHFALLVLGGSKEISEGHKKALDIITAVGSGLSILGLLVVFLTAIIFKTYRSANAIVINFSVAMTAQIVLLFVADNVAGDELLCTIFGAALHYIVLSQFCWMLTIAILQYRRYVVVFGSPTPHLVAKSCAFAWGIPLIPMIIIISISRENYGENSYGLCYALGNSFIFGVLIPVSLIIFINLIVFLRIMLSIASSRRIKVHQKRDNTSSLQLRLAIMLYFLLGLTWGFGLLAAIGGGIAYSYLFCITATLQGFVLFLYFIVLNEKTRQLWINMKLCCCKSKCEEYEVNTDSAATAMVRRARTTNSSDTNTTHSTTSEMLRRINNRSSSDF